MNIGCVDNSSLLNGVFKGNPSIDYPLKCFGIDINPILIARCQIIYQMLLDNCPDIHIFEVWYLSCLTIDC